VPYLSTAGQYLAFLLENSSEEMLPAGIIGMKMGVITSHFSFESVVRFQFLYDFERFPAIFAQQRPGLDPLKFGMHLLRFGITFHRTMSAIEFGPFF
jgi:hypothetical protein